MSSKTCGNCGETFPATTEYFHRDGIKLYSRCKTCKNQYSRKSYNKNKKEHNAKRVQREKKRYTEDAAYKLKRNLSRRLNHCMRKDGESILNFIGCSINEAKRHIEKQFTEGMSWDNYGEWHVDHIRPCSSFNFSNKVEAEACFHYTNLQPLWAEDNIRKADHYV